MNLKNKFLFIFVSIIFIICLSNTKCFALNYNANGALNSFDDTLIEECSNYSVSDIKNYISVYYENVGYTLFYCSFDEEIKPYFYEDDVENSRYYLNFLRDEDVADFTIYDFVASHKFKYTPSTNTLEYLGLVDASVPISYSALSEKRFYSPIDVYYTDGEVVFQQPPQVQEQVGTLAPIVEEMETKKTLAEVVGILPLIIVVVVSLVGLRKALKMLLAVLHRA